MRDRNLPIPEMRAAEGGFEAILYRNVNPDGPPPECLRALTCIRTLSVLRWLDFRERLREQRRITYEQEVGDGWQTIREVPIQSHAPMKLGRAAEVVAAAEVVVADVLCRRS